MAIINDTALAATKNALIIALVQRELIAKGVIMPSLTDGSVYAVKGSKSLGVPRGSSMTVEDRATGVQAANVSVTYATDTITLDQMSTVAWIIDPQDEVESAIDVESDVAGRAARAHAKNFDAKVLVGLEAASVATTTAGAISKSIFLEMRQKLLTANADPSQLTFLCGPDSEANLLAISEFVQQYSVGNSAIPTGVIGSLYGVQIKMSTQIATNAFYMYDKAGYGFAIQKQLAIGEREAPEYGTGAKLRVMDMKWGHAVLENSLLVFKDNN
jgi:hypothetical protein